MDLPHWPSWSLNTKCRQPTLQHIDLAYWMFVPLVPCHSHQSRDAVVWPSIRHQSRKDNLQPNAEGRCLHELVSESDNPVEASLREFTVVKMEGVVVTSVPDPRLEIQVDFACWEVRNNSIKIVEVLNNQDQHAEFSTNQETRRGNKTYSETDSRCSMYRAGRYVIRRRGSRVVRYCLSSSPGSSSDSESNIPI